MIISLPAEKMSFLKRVHHVHEKCPPLVVFTTLEEDIFQKLRVLSCDMLLAISEMAEAMDFFVISVV